MKQHPLHKNYFITEDGKVFSTFTKKWIKHYFSHNGYLRYTLRVNGKSKKYFAHRLVAETYLIKPEGAECLNHIDKDRTNNHYLNLEWVTINYNVHYSHSKHWIVEKISSGEKIEIYNLNNWCKKNNINQGNLYSSMMRNGTSQGYRLYKVENK